MIHMLKTHRLGLIKNNVGGNQTFLLGLGADIEGKISIKPIVDFFTGEAVSDSLSVSGGDGVILTECATALVGD